MDGWIDGWKDGWVLYALLMEYRTEFTLYYTLHSISLVHGHGMGVTRLSIISLYVYNHFLDDIVIRQLVPAGVFYTLGNFLRNQGYQAVTPTSL